jgi:ABC-type spermidine/putrescine transport system permease subunit II
VSVASSDRRVDVALTAHAGIVYAFLYLPIVVVVIYAFNDGRLVQIWEGFSTRWFGEAWRDDTLRSAFRISLITATLNAILATVLGTAAGMALRNVGRRTRTTFDAFMYTTLIVPEIVIAIASLLFFVTIGLPLGPLAIVITHSVFNTSVVGLIVRARLAGMDRSLEEASADLGATRLATFRQVTLPQLFPAVMAGALLAFTFSFDDVVLSSFVSGVGSTTLPVEIFSQIRFGVSPKVNVVAVATLSLTITAIITAQLLLRREARRVS